MSQHEVVVITGASAGVGRATVREFAKHGAWVGLIARGRDGLEAARREVEAEGGKALVAWSGGPNPIACCSAWRAWQVRRRQFTPRLRTAG